MKKFQPILFIKNRIRGIVFGRTRLGEIVNSVYGTYIFLKYSFTKKRLKSQNNYKSYLTKQYHIIEKGLSLPNPRSNFGKKKIISLLKKSEHYIKKYGEDKLISTIRACLKEYLISNTSLRKIDNAFFVKIESFSTSNDGNIKGGTKNINKKHIQKITNIDYEEFVKTRTSVRDFSISNINIEDVVKAVNIARHAPSVCNRQAWKIHFYNNRNVMDSLLALQAGNAGFTESIKALLIITTNTESFTNLERDQVFIDGGLISMNLLLALHHINIGSCCLNICFPFTTEIKVKKIAGIKPQERLIMMIGIGYLKDEFKSAYSVKKSVQEIFVQH